MDWSSIFSTSANIVSVLTALGALIVSYRVYRIQKSIENENQFFGHKMSQYQSIIQHAAELHDLYYESFLDFKEILQEGTINTEEIYNLADVVDAKTTAFRLALYKHASFLPEEIVKRLDDFYNHLYDESELLEVESLPLSKIDELLTRLDRLEDELENIVNLMRKDLGIETIDRKLKVRTHR